MTLERTAQEPQTALSFCTSTEKEVFDMKLLTAMQMTELEQLAIQEYGIDSLLLMENAARGFCDVLEAEFGACKGKNIYVFCGKGNNGGDGFAISRHLYNRGARVVVVPGFEPASLKKDAKKNFDIITRMGIPVRPLSELSANTCDLIVDALLGTGLSGEPKEETKVLIDTINQSAVPVISVDMPSGGDASFGQVSGACVQADVTVTFGSCKPGQFLYPAKKFCGKVLTADISIPRHLLLDFPTPYHLMGKHLAKKLPQRKENSHKGSFGKLLVFAGSTGMSGASVMAASAAMKSGAGMVTVAAPKNLMNVLDSHFTEIMTLPLPTDGDVLAQSAAGILDEKLKSQDVLLAGCGIGTSDIAKKTLLALVKSCQKPMVIDADGINALKEHIDVAKDKSIPAILTPHPLEFSRISGYSLEKIQENRLEIARDFAKKYKVVLVLKGADTVVAFPDGTAYLCPQSNSGLAKAGSGDVLSGVIAALLAQGASPENAAVLGVYLHSLAGIIARSELGAYGMTATDVISALPKAFLEMTNC